MNTNDHFEETSISGVPKEVQENIKSDLVAAPALGRSRKRIGISVSENVDLGELGYSKLHLRDLTVEIVRNLLINDMNIIYGGDLREEGYTEVFSDLAYQYRLMKESKQVYFENYFAYPIHRRITRQHELDFKKARVEIHLIKAPSGILEQKDYFPPDSNAARSIWARSLTEMRNVMIENSEARILVGGKLEGYSGKKPGVIEEAHIALDKNKPLYLVGAFGGATLEVINTLNGRPFIYTENNYHKEKEFNEFCAYYNAQYPDETIDPNADFTFFSSYGLERLSQVNGLSIEENKRLFITPHLSEILFLILKGLNKISTSQKESDSVN